MVDIYKEKYNEYKIKTVFMECNKSAVFYPLIFGAEQ